jgi:hypothetical protein
LQKDLKQLETEFRVADKAVTDLAAKIKANDDLIQKVQTRNKAAKEAAAESKKALDELFATDKGNPDALLVATEKAAEKGRTSKTADKELADVLNSKSFDERIKELDVQVQGWTSEQTRARNEQTRLSGLISTKLDELKAARRAQLTYQIAEEVAKLKRDLGNTVSKDEHDRQMAALKAEHSRQLADLEERMNKKFVEQGIVMASQQQQINDLRSGQVKTNAELEAVKAAQLAAEKEFNKLVERVDGLEWRIDRVEKALGQRIDLTQKNLSKVEEQMLEHQFQTAVDARKAAEQQAALNKKLEEQALELKKLNEGNKELADKYAALKTLFEHHHHLHTQVQTMVYVPATQPLVTWYSVTPVTEYYEFTRLPVQYRLLVK